MKRIVNIYDQRCRRILFLMLSMLLTAGVATAQQDSTATEAAATESEVQQVKKVKPVKNTFESIWIIDNQTVMVPVKNTFEMDIMHRFGTVKKGYEDFWGFFAPSNIRLGFNYVPINNLLVGASITKANMTWEGYAKYAIIKQTKGKYPVSVSFLSDVAYDSRSKDKFIYPTERWSFFHQLMVARKITDKISVQVSPSLSHQNSVVGYWKDSGKVAGEMKHDHLAIAFSGRYQIKKGMTLVANVDQPITQHPANNPNPNISFGLEMSTGSHCFQFFLGNYSYITPQRNNLFNRNDPADGQFLIGFNITRLWNY